MLNWRSWSGTADAWDGLLQQFADYTVYQSHAWGEHRSHFGWRPLRLILEDAGAVVAMAQILVRRYPLGIGVVWVPGGPLGSLDLCGPGLQQAISREADARFLYCRLNSMRPYSVDDAQKLNEQGWRPSASPINTGLSLLYQPALNDEVRLKQCSGNWRHNLRRSAKHGLRAYRWVNPSPDEVMAAYISMQDHKNLKAQTSRGEIESLITAFGEQCLLVRCDDEHDNLLALRGALLLGEKAWDIFAAATPAGRKVYASHAAFWELMKQCATRCVKFYDMSGVDPINNRGVYDFKKGTGAADLRYVGEWEYARPSMFGPLAGKIIAWRISA